MQPKMEVIDRFNLPYEYVKHHPEHKKLQGEYVGLKRVCMEMELGFKKSREAYEEEIQKLRIEVEFHKQRIGEL